MDLTINRNGVLHLDDLVIRTPRFIIASRQINDKPGIAEKTTGTY
jgi:hypothetical protein